MDHLHRSLETLGQRMESLTCAIKSLNDTGHILTRIEQMESRILSAIQGGKDAELKAMTTDLEKSSRALAQAITDSKQPTEK